MDLVAALLGEHAMQHALFDRIDVVLAADPDAATVRAYVDALTVLLKAHAAAEDELLLPALAQHVGDGGPVAAMHAEHGEIEAALQRLPSIHNTADLARGLADLIALARDHFLKEERILFRLAERVMGDELDELGRRWQARRQLLPPPLERPATPAGAPPA